MNARWIKRILVCAVAVLIAFCASAEAWETTVNGRPTSDTDTALGVAVDPLTGSIFVAGRRQVSSTTSQFFVVKFTSAGEKQWQETVEGTADLGVSAGAVTAAVDSNGFVFFAGTIGNISSGTDFVLLKMDGRSSRKRVLWKRIFDSGLGHDDSVNAMTLTPDNGVVIAGSVSTASGAQNFYLTKFTSDGQDAWPSPQIISGTAPNGSNMATAVDAFSNGDIAVTGWLSNAGSNEDFVVGRFDGATGARQWMVALNDPRVNGSDLGTAIRVAPNDDVVAGGITQASSRGDFSVFRLSGAGTLLWQTIIDRGFFDAVRTVAIAPNGDIIAGGTLEPPSGPNNSVFFVVNLGADGLERWRFESPGTSSFLEARDIGFDANGNPIVTGQSQQSDQALTTFPVIALDIATGNVLWNVPVVGTAPFLNAGEAVVADPNTGAAIAVGVTQNDRTSFDLTITSITEGHENWRQIISGRGKRVDRDDAALAIAIDPRRNSIALAGYAQNTGAGLLGTPQEFRVVKIRKNGAVAWKFDLNDSLPHIDNAALAAAVDDGGDFFAAGRSCSTTTSCFTVVRVGRNGKEIWRNVLPGLTPGRDEARAIIQDPEDGNVIVAGNVQTAAGAAFAVFKLDANSGAVLWPASAQSFPLGRANALALTSRGTVAVAGSVQGSFAVLEFDTRSGTIFSSGILAGAGEADSVASDDHEGTVLAGGSQRLGPFGAVMTVAKFNAKGSATWLKNLGDEFSGNPAVPVALHADTGAIAVGGALAGSGGTVFTVVLLDPNGNELWRSNDIPGAAESIAFAQDQVIAAGQFRDGNRLVIAVASFALDKTEEWSRTFPGTADFGLDSAHAVAFDEKKAAVFAAGVITDNPTGPDMFAIGLGIDGSDLSGLPVASRPSSSQGNVTQASAVELGAK